MARTVKEIQDDIISVVSSDPALNTRLTSSSKTALWRLFTYVFAFASNFVERLFDTFTADVREIIAAQKPHTARWYVEKIKDFQFGYNLPIDSDVYDNSALTDDAVADSQIVKYAAATRSRRANGRLFLRLKAAKLVGDDLGPLADAEKTALDDYIFRIADAGVDYTLESLPADQLKQSWRIFYNPEILNDQGERLDGSVESPVRNGIKNYLLNLPFNGEFRTTYHQDAVQAIEGVVDCKLEVCQVRYGLLPFTTVSVSHLPDAGYMRFANDADLVIVFEPLSQIV